MIVGALLCRNEAAPDRYLRRSVENALLYCDKIVAFDDGSTDNTIEVLQEYPKVEIVSPESTSGAQASFWGHDESTPRALLWEKAAQRGSWVYVFDADHELVGITPEEFRLLTRSNFINAWAFPLYDCWDSDNQMRVDGYWQAHLHPRPWLIKSKPSGTYVPRWQAKAIHCGHHPHNYPIQVSVAPGLAAIRHLGYIKPEHRQAKHESYTSLNHLTDFERAHAESILEPAVTAPISPPKPKVLVASVVRKPTEIVEGLIKTIEWQETDAEVTRWLIANYPSVEEYDHEPFDAHVTAPTGDYGEGEVTRSWTKEAFTRIAGLKDGLIQKALTEGFDYLWLVDADVMCDPYTLQTLIDSDTPIVSAVYWTNWQLPKEGLKTFVHAGPQVWQRGAYQMDSLLMTEPEFRRKLIDRARLKVGGLGACTLLRRDAMEKGVRFEYLKENPMGPGGMGDGEDRHFCARARALHVPLVADAWSDIWHAYHPAEYDQLEDRLKVLNDWLHSDSPATGELVSITIEPLEPIPDSKGRMHNIGKKYVRGRLGALPVLPQIEEAVAGLSCGDSTLLRVHYPIHFTLAQLQGKTQLMRVTLLDCKSFRIAPVIDTELFQGNKSQGYLDAVSLTPEQVSSMVEDSQHE